VDVRLIAATNQPLESLTREKRFREDLFYRLNVIPLHMPPLRERREDIPALAEHFLRRFSAEMGKGITKISGEAMARLERYPWPGNVRELENVIERACALETTDTIRMERLPDTLLQTERSAVAPATTALGDGFRLDDHLNALEADFVLRALEQSGGDRARASSLLGLAPRSLRYLIRKHGLSPVKN